MSEQAVEVEPPLVKNSLNLPTYQRRLRHLHGIAIRNLQLPRNQTIDFTKLQVHFTLHKSNKEEALYTSEKITGSLNPTWQSFDLQRADSEVNLTTKFVVVRIWMSHGEGSKVKIEANVNLSGLIFFSDKLQVVGLKHQPNTLLFEMYGGFFIHHDNSESNSKLGDWLPDTVIPGDNLPAAMLDQATLRSSYNTNSLTRIHTVQRAIKQTQASVRRIHSQLEDKLLSSKENSEKLSQREVLLMRVRQLRHELLWQTQKRQVEQEGLESLKAQQDTKLNDVRAKRKSLQNLHKETEENRDMHIQSREMLVKENAQVLFRRKQLISEMVQYIYPITEDEKNNFSIAKVELPNAENYQGHDDVRLSVALGFSCHLVQMVSHFMDMPLRYAMKHSGSRSIILDHIHSKLSDRDREFPLYGKGSQKYQFNYAVFLLNKNISQLRFFCGLGTSDLRQTLPNLRTLFEQRLGVKGNASPTEQVQVRDASGHGSQFSGQNLRQDLTPGTRTSLSASDLDPNQSASSIRSGSSGGRSSARGGGGVAAVIEGIGLTNLNGNNGNVGEANKVIVRPLVPDFNTRDYSSTLDRSLSRDSENRSWYFENGDDSSELRREFSGSGMSTSPESKKFYDGQTINSGEAINEEDEGDEDLFTPADEDAFFQGGRKQTLDTIASVLAGAANDEALPPGLREQVLGNGLLDDSDLAGLSKSPDGESRTFKLVSDRKWPREESKSSLSASMSPEFPPPGMIMSDSSQNSSISPGPSANISPSSPTTTNGRASPGFKESQIPSDLHLKGDADQGSVCSPTLGSISR